MIQFIFFSWIKVEKIQKLSQRGWREGKRGIVHSASSSGERPTEVQQIWRNECYFGDKTNSTWCLVCEWCEICEWLEFVGDRLSTLRHSLFIFKRTDYNTFLPVSSVLFFTNLFPLLMTSVCKCLKGKNRWVDLKQEREIIKSMNKRMDKYLKEIW